MSLLSIILGGFLVLSYQTLSLGKVVTTKTLSTNKNQSQNINFTFKNNTSKNEPPITQNYRYPRPIEKLPPLIITSSTKQKEAIFNPIKVNPFSNLQYIVYIESESKILLRIIRQKIEPRAVFRYIGNRKVIQVGSFSELCFALNLLDVLEEKGINGQLSEQNPGEAFGDPLRSTTLAAIVYPPVRDSIAYGLSNMINYYLLIPSQLQDLDIIDLDIIRYKLRLLGVPDKGIQVTEIPKNVAIGPFENEETAEKWQGYLLDSGFINVVIYYGR
ncbi:MAG: hypothetical protein MGG11_14970 [Trichodesmium sp. MAG_R03]|nr:hypothetical protein [Trichodesmium sp. MAG_R03]